MSFSYDKLWKKAIDNKMNKTQVRDKSGITNASLARLSKNQYVSMHTLDKLCKCFNCDISEIMEYIDEEVQGNGTDK